MIRSLWTAASGMVSQQTNVDTIANNLANVNTIGYKAERAEFKSLLYQTLQARTTSANGEEKPISAQVGLGVRNSAIISQFKQGNPTETDSATAFAIIGDGFFAVRGAGNSTYYTRNGNFNWAVGNNGMTLATSDGLPVLDSTGKEITVNKDYITNNIGVDSNGELFYPNAQGQMRSLNIRIGTYQFNNPSGLDKLENSLYGVNAASGEALNEATNNNLQKSSLRSHFLESSNVQVADEMVNLIVAQRAYELNSKAIQASDEMMQQANSLRR